LSPIFSKAPYFAQKVRNLSCSRTRAYALPVVGNFELLSETIAVAIDKIGSLAEIRHKPCIGGDRGRRALAVPLLAGGADGDPFGGVRLPVKTKTSGAPLVSPSLYGVASSVHRRANSRCGCVSFQPEVMMPDNQEELGQAIAAGLAVSRSRIRGVRMVDRRAAMFGGALAALVLVALYLLFGPDSAGCGLFNRYC
jgi:hypothetical protein